MHTKKTVLCLLAFFATASWLRGSSLTLGAGTSIPSGTVSLPLSWSADGDSVASIQWTMTFSATDFSAIQINAAPAAAQAGKSIQCHVTSATAYTCLLTGMNATDISDGVVATAVLTVASSGASASAPVGVVSAVGSTPTGDARVVSGIGNSVTVGNIAQISSISCSPTSVRVGETANCTVRLTQNAPAGGATVTLGQAGSQGITATMPTSLSIPAGTAVGNFPIAVTAANSSSNLAIAATLNGVSKTYSLSILAISVSVTPTSSTVYAGSTQQFTATLANALTTGVTWSVNPAVGTISPTGLYTATALISSPQSISIRATSLADPTKFATATVNLAILDTTPPTVPGNLTVMSRSSSSINLSWTGPTDNVGITGCRVERCQGAGCTNFSEVGQTVAGTTYNDSGLAPSASYSYRVRAMDTSGNLSGYSNVVNAATTANSPVAGLVAAYSFNEGTGTTVADSSGNGNTGKVNGATWSTQGKYGNAMEFNGINSLVEINGSASLNVSTGMTLEAWIYPTANQSGWRTIVQRQVDSYFLNASSNAGALYPAGGGTFNGTTNYVAGTASNPLNTWTHVAFTYDGTTLRLYVNGVQVSTKPASGPIETNSNALRIGGNVPYGEYFTGRIDEVRVYNRALTPAEIQTDVNAPIEASKSDTTSPTAPAALTATAAGMSQINLSWPASTDNTGVTSYRVERCQGTSCTNFAQVATPATNSLTDAGLLAGTTYKYRVRATDAAGNVSSYSPAATATTQSDTTAPTVPSGFKATAANSNQINLSWTASTDNVGVTGYRLERCQRAGCTNFVQIATPSATSYNDTGLAAGMLYRYRVRATDAAGWVSGYSAIVKATTTAVAAAANGLVAAYAFNEGAGTTVADVSGNGNTGTINRATWTSTGKHGSALNFNGTDAIVTINASPSLNVSASMTLEAWIYPTAQQSGWRTILQREVDAYFLNASNSTGNLRPSGGGTFNGAVDYVGGPSANPVNTWTHVALTYNGTTLQLYVNGIQVSSKAMSGAIQTNSSPLRIGGNSPYGEYFNGRIDEVRIYNRALSQAEIQTDMSTPLVP
jgi:hypothetical protein